MKSNTLKHIRRASANCALTLALTLGGWTGTAHAQDRAVIYSEEATSPAGPWTRIAPGTYPTDSDGNPVIPLDQGDTFFRTRIQPWTPTGGPTDPIPLADLPPAILRMAALHVTSFDDGTEDDPDGGWEDVEFGPLAFPVFDPLASNPLLPAYVEFELLPANPEAPLGGRFLKDSAVGDVAPHGFLIVSLTEEDFPIVEFATDGSTRCQELAALARTTQIRVVRYGSTFWAAEDADGNLLANFGAQPFKPDPAFVAEFGVNHNANGDDDTETDNRPENRSYKHGHYLSYDDFKQDYATNPVYALLHARRKALAKVEWDATNGIRPLVLDVAVGTTETFFTRQTVEAFNLVTEEIEPDRLARIAIQRSGGLQIGGLSPGRGTLDVRIAGKTTPYLLRINSPVAGGGRSPRAFTPGWQPLKKTYSSTWAEQPRHYQVSKSDLCPLMGCGPVAWSTYFVWVEKAKGVKGAYGSLYTTDGKYGQSTSNGSTLVKQQRLLHDLCDVICSPFGDSGATGPGDMTEGGLGYSYLPALIKVTKRSWRMTWDLGDYCAPTHGLYCRDAVKNGYIAPVGLGWLWHYAVAYGYAYQHYDIVEGQHLYTRRYLKCNMGWGNHKPCWYNLCDTFWGADIRVRDGANAQ